MSLRPLRSMWLLADEEGGVFAWVCNSARIRAT